MNCSDPADVETLVAYWLGELPVQREEGLEAHLIACAHCSRRLEELVAMAAGVRAAVKAGKVSMVVAASFVEAMKEAGLRLREYRLDAGGSVNCTIHAHDDAVISRLRAPLAGVQRLDVVQMRSGSEPDVRLADVPFDAETGEVLVIPSAAWLKSMPEFTMRMRLIAMDGARETPLGDYTFNHAPS